MRAITPLVLSLLLAGCATRNTVLVQTGTMIGIKVAQNQTTGMYEAKLGYVREELALVPTTNGVAPDVMTELKFSGLFSIGSDGGIYQRMAVGSNAVTQPGAVAMFIKDGNGQVGTNAAAAVKALVAPLAPTPNASIQSDMMTVASNYKNSDAIAKGLWDSVAKQSGYSSFAAFLIDPGLSRDKFTKITSDLRTAGLIQ